MSVEELNALIGRQSDEIEDVEFDPELLARINAENGVIEPMN